MPITREELDRALSLARAQPREGRGPAFRPLRPPRPKVTPPALAGARPGASRNEVRG